MIQKAVYTYWNKDRSYTNTSGFSTLRDFLASITLSVLLSKQHFGEVELVSDVFGKGLLINKLGLPFTSFNPVLERWSGLDRHWWGLTKIIAYKEQKVPFIHVDNDAYIIDKPSEKFLDGKLCFQSLEAPFSGWYGWYRPLLERAKNAKSYPEVVKNYPTDYAFNCGVAGGNDLEIFQEWFKAATEYDLSPENKPYFKSIQDIIIHQNLLSEQYFIACIAKSKEMKLGEDVQFLLDYTNLHNEANKPGQRFAHLWGGTKRDSSIIKRVYDRLERDFPDYHNKVMSF